MIILLIGAVWLGSLAVFVGLRVKATKTTPGRRAPGQRPARVESGQQQYRRGGPAVPLRS